MKLHEPIDVGRKSINTILHARESLVHFLPENAKVKIDDIESPINLHKSAINLLKSPVNLRESTINLLNSPIIPRKPAIDLLESRIRPLKSSSKKPFNSCKALIDGSSFLCRFLLDHLPYLAALSPDESQDLKSSNHLIRPHSDFRFWISDFGLLRIPNCNLRFAICHLQFRRVSRTGDSPDTPPATCSTPHRSRESRSVARPRRRCFRPAPPL